MNGAMAKIQLSIGSNHILYGGGSGFGVDFVAEETAKDYGVENEIVPVQSRSTYSASAAVEEAILSVSVTLRRPVPRHFYTYSIIERYYHMARKAETLFAFGHIHPNRKEVRGGTGWAIQPALDQGTTVFVFDLDNKSWYSAERKYDTDPATDLLRIRTEFTPWGSSELPTLHLKSTVVGSQLIDQDIEKEVKNLFHLTFCTMKNVEAFRKELEELLI